MKLKYRKDVTFLAHPVYLYIFITAIVLCGAVVSALSSSDYSRRAADRQICIRRWHFLVPRHGVNRRPLANVHLLVTARQLVALYRHYFVQLRYSLHPYSIRWHC